MRSCSLSERGVRHATEGFAEDGEEVVGAVGEGVVFAELLFDFVEGVAALAYSLEDVATGLESGGCCFEVLVDAEWGEGYVLMAGWVCRRWRWASARKWLVLGSKAKSRVPLMVLMLLKGITCLSFL